MFWIVLTMSSVVGLSTGRVSAEPDIEELSRKLTEGKDFRVRTQAALALGASASRGAVAPLCTGLDDDNTTVRAAAAAALGRLALGGDVCLKRRLGQERQGDVRSVIERALTRLKPKEPNLGPNTQFYISIGKIELAESAKPEDGQQLDGVLRKHFEQADGVALSPSGEDRTAAARRLAKFKKVKGVLLLPTLKVLAVGGALQLRLEVALLSYPDKVLKGTISRKLTMPDTPISDKSSLKELIEMAVEQLIPDVRKTAAKI